MYPTETRKPAMFTREQVEYYETLARVSIRRLIAAAPELLEALEAVLPDLEHYVATHGPGPDKRLALAREAIAKAKGGEK